MPEDFGLVTMSLIVIWFSQAYQIQAMKKYLQSRKKIKTADINTSFTLDIIIKSIIYISISLISTEISEY